MVRNKKPWTSRYTPCYVPRMEHALKRFRLSANISADQLAKAAGTSRQTIHRLENGHQVASLWLVSRLIKATGGAVTADDFLPGETPPHQHSDAAE